MPDRSSSVRDIHPPANRLGLRAQAAEQLIQATDREQAARALFDLISADLRLNVFLLYATAGGRLELVAHAGLSQEEALIAEAIDPPAEDVGKAVITVPEQQRGARARHEEIAACLGAMGVKAWFNRPLMDGDRLLGTIGFGRRWAERFSEDELAFLESVTHYFALAFDRFRKDAALRENEQRLRLGMDVTGFRTYDHDLLTGQTILSPDILAMIGFPPDQPADDELLRKGVHPDDRERLAAARLASFDPQGTGGYDGVFRVVRPDGEIVWLHSCSQTFFAGEGKARRAVRTLSAIRDVTQEKLAEQRLRDSEERLQHAQELGGVASFDWTLGGEPWVSESYRQVFGLEPTAPLDILSFYSLVHPDDRERVIDAYNLAEDAERYEIEYRIIRPIDLKVRWVHSVMGVFRDSANNVSRLAGITMDITERKRDEERERLLSREIDHRAKNLLSVVQAMVQLTHANSISEFTEIVKGRIHALGRVHSLLAASRWNGAELSILIGDELTPFEDDEDGHDKDRFTLIGPSVSLKPAAAQSMAVVIHELTTNAAKYGALSVPDGHVEVVWEAENMAEGRLVLHWLESGGPPPKQPEEVGFGLTLIRASIERQLGGTLEFDWRPEGLSCKLSLPSRQIAQDGGI